MDTENIPMGVEYIPDGNFAGYVREQPEKELVNMDGSMRWIITKEDGTKVIVRPESTR